SASVASPAPAPAPCDPAETERLQQAVVGAAPGGINAAAAVKTTCGIRFFSAGPSSIGADTLHRIGSVSKTYLGALMVLLARDGLLDLDDTVATFGIDVPDGERITVRQLLHHQSGLYNYTDDPSVYLSPRSWQPEELLQLVQAHDLNFEPGTQYAYSN